MRYFCCTSTISTDIAERKCSWLAVTALDLARSSPEPAALRVAREKREREAKEEAERVAEARRRETEQAEARLKKLQETEAKVLARMAAMEEKQLAATAGAGARDVLMREAMRAQEQRMAEMQASSLHH